MIWVFFFPLHSPPTLPSWQNVPLYLSLASNLKSCVSASWYSKKIQGARDPLRVTWISNMINNSERKAGMIIHWEYVEILLPQCNTYYSDKWRGSVPIIYSQKVSWQQKLFKKLLESCNSWRQRFFSCI